MKTSSGANRLKLLGMNADAGDERNQSSPRKGFVGKLSSISSAFSGKSATTLSSPNLAALPLPPAAATETGKKPALSKEEADIIEACQGTAERGELEEAASAVLPETPLTNKTTGMASPEVANPVDPEIKVVTLEVREPALEHVVVGQVVILDGSCYVWAAIEGSSAQGSLAAAVGTRFYQGVPTVTALLASQAGAGSGVTGESGSGLSVSMAQRLCRRTGRVVFVSCDIPEDSHLLIAAVEAKVVALLKDGSSAS